MNLVALHGFLGHSKDFSKLVEKLNPETSWCPDLFGGDQIFLQGGFESWTTKALQYIEKKLSQPIDLIGYSLGGRLALHLVMKEPQLFNKVILLSTHPGIFDSNEKNQRHEWEASWVKKINISSFEEFIFQWNQQKLFEGEASERFLRESDFSRVALQKALVEFSNTAHQFSLEDLKNLEKSLIWVVGENDQKFVKIAKDLRQMRGSLDQFEVIPNAGHRLIAEKEQAWLYELFSRK